jgi:potassium efflux system protein
VAAISVGLGFGLQEIFANFVSGLVILFERPIRVGDIVTISDVSGVVSRIRIRATTITTWDRKELIVPNKEFITGRLLNWTLSDHVNRVEIKVGVAYGSDVGRVQSLLQKLASDHPHVLPDPAPIATFEGFGDSTLIFVLRCYLATLEHRLAVIHELHAGIHDTFRREQIEIAFPQRDLHLRTVPADPPDRKHPQANPPAPHFDFQPASSSNRSEFEILGRSMADEKSSLRGGK